MPAFLECRRQANGAAWLDDRFKQLSALDQGDGAQVVAVEIQQIEQEQRGGLGAGQSGDRAGVRDHDARLNQGEAWASAFVEHADLAVEDSRLRVDEMR